MKSQITIQSIQNILLNSFTTTFVNDETSRRMWWAALEVIQKEFLLDFYHQGGLWVASPLPVINEKKYLNKLKGWLWAPEGFPYFKKDYIGLLPEDLSNTTHKDLQYLTNHKLLNLSKSDCYDPFLLIITPNFQCVLSLVGEKDQKILLMRSDEESLHKTIKLIDAKLCQENFEEALNFRESLKNLGDLKINYEFVDTFWPRLSSKLATLIPHVSLKAALRDDVKKNFQVTEAKLLEAISHEVRTPLATIRTLISSTLKKYDMDIAIRSRLIQIDNECTEQINRFGLIFNAAELVSNEASTDHQLVSINLGDILYKLSPQWIDKLQRRGIALRLDIPKELPKILSNSEKLELMLRGLIDKNTRGLREGSTLIMELHPAGQKLKLQLIVKTLDESSGEINNKQDGADIGPVLNWNPQTGNLQLSQSATQKLLASLGGHVTSRKGTGLTVFFPISELN